MWVVYTRSDDRFPCQACYDLNTRTSRATCRICFGTGRKVTLERWMACYTNTLRGTQTRDAPLNLLGWTPENEPLVLTKSANIPVIGDRFFLVEWDRAKTKIPGQARPIRILEALNVAWVEPLLAKGEVIYYTSHCDRVTENIRDYEQSLYDTAVITTRR